MARIFLALIFVAFLEGVTHCQEKPMRRTLAEDLAALEGQWVKVNPPKGEDITLTFRIMGNNKSISLSYSVDTPKLKGVGNHSVSFNLVEKDNKRFMVQRFGQAQRVTYHFDAQKLLLDGQWNLIDDSKLTLTGQWKKADKKEDKK
jgi:hypothetical protein